MEIIDLKIIHGSNLWSDTDKQLVILSLDINFGNNIPKSDTEKFKENLKKLFVKDDIEILEKEGAGLIAYAVAYIARELQLLAKIYCPYVKIESNIKNEYIIILPFDIEKTAEFAARTAVKIASALLNNENYQIQTDIDKLLSLKRKYYLGATTSYILSEIKKEGIPYRQFNNSPLIILGYGVNQKKIKTAVTNLTSGLGIEIAADKEETKKLLAEEQIPVPNGIMISSKEELFEQIGQVKFPLVVKPLDGNHGRGITTNINSMDDVLFGFKLAQQISETVVVEEFVEGNDYRFLVINYKLVAVANRIPAFVTGNGYSTIIELIEQQNKHPERQNDNGAVLAPIVIDEITEKILSDKKLSAHSVLTKGETLTLKSTANISAGGIAEDVTDTVHPENVFLAERIARMFNLDICGIDIMAKAVDIPITREAGAIIEVNAGPGLRMHSNPQKGKPRNVAKAIVEMLFPEAGSSRIPLIAISETEDADSISQLISHFAERAGYKPGYNTSEGVYIQGHLTSKGNCSDFKHGQEVLYDPTLDFAIVQSSDKSITDSGIAFDFCDVSIINGFSEDYISDGHAFTKEQIKLKTVLLNSTKLNGYAIFNADLDQLQTLKAKAKCKVALYSARDENKVLQEHYLAGGIGATVENGKIVIYDKKKPIEIADIKSVLFSKNQDLTLNIILPALLAAYISGLKTTSFIEAISSFKTRRSLKKGSFLEA